MADSASLIKRFREAVAALEARIDDAEAQIGQSGLEALKAEREKDLVEIKALRDEIAEIKRKVQNG